jgi:hypothetical protein
MNIANLWSKTLICYFHICLCLPVLISISFPLFAQGISEDGEAAICKIKAGGKVHTLSPNEVGAFKVVPNIQPLQIVPIEIIYPNSSPNEKVQLSVEDGGALENGKSGMVLQLNDEKQISFTFQPSRQPGLYRISLYKGSDVKTVQVWVGSKPAPTRKLNE